MGILSHLRIGQRLWLGFGGLCALLAVASGVVVVQTNSLKASVDSIVNLRQPVVENSTALETNLYASLAALRGFLLTGDARFKDQRAEAWRNMDAMAKGLDEMTKRFTNPRNVELWRDARDQLQNLRQAQERSEAAGGQEGVKILVAEALPRVARLVVILEGEPDRSGIRTGGMISNQKLMLNSDARDVDHETATLLSISVGALLVGIGLAVAIALATVKAIVPALKGMTSAMVRMADGDLEVAIEVGERRDEVGDMAKSMEVFRDKMRQQRELEAAQHAQEEMRRQRAERIAGLTAAFDQTVSGVMATVSSAARQLEAAAGTMSAAAMQTSRQADAVAGAAEHASSNVQTVASAAEELSSSIGEISRQVGQASQISGNAVGEAGRAQSVVAELAETVRRIGDVVSLITDIASQTNLLALNATIEAARAGEAGKGFAVVANEVKGLATQTAKATDEISQQIASVQGQTERVVATIQGIVRVIEEVGEISAGIAAAVEQQAAATSEIARNVEEAARGTAEVTDNVGGVQAAASDAGSSAEQVHSASAALKKEADHLRETVGTFIADVRAA